MKLDKNLEVALADLKRRWKTKPPTDCERFAVSRLELSGAAWNSLLTEKARYKVTIDHRKVLDFVIDSFKLVEGESEIATLERTLDKFARLDNAFDTLLSFYRGRSDINAPSTKTSDRPEGGDDEAQLRILRRLVQHVNVIRELDIAYSIQFPIVKQTEAAHDHALNFACGLSYLLRRCHKRPFETFCMAMADVIYEGATFSGTALYNHSKEREEEVNRALQEAMQRNDSVQD